MPAKVIITGDKKVERKFHAISDNAKDVSKAWPKVGNVISSRVNRQFMTNGAYFGTPWKRLTPAYKARKARMGFPTNRMLVTSGAMKRSFTGRPMDIEVYRPQSATFGSSNQKAVWHQYGTYRHGKRVNPPRKMLVITKSLRRDIRDIVARHIMKGN